jgi:hypothetical protein
VHGHSRRSDGARSPVRGDVECCRLPYQDGRATHCALAAVSSTVQSVLGRSPSEAFRVEVVDQMLAKF